MKKPNILLWDVDGTLLDFEKSEKEAFLATFKEFNMSYKEEYLPTYQKINQSYWRRLEAGEITKGEVIYGRFFEFFDIVKIKNMDHRIFQDIYQKKLGSIWFENENAISLLSELKNSFTQIIVTNGVKKTQENKLALSGIDQIVQDIFISDVIGHEKPDPLFFKPIFEKYPDYKKEQFLIIGDSLTSDILGGNQVGIKTCYYNKSGKELHNIRPDYQIKNLEEIKKIIFN